MAETEDNSPILLKAHSEGSELVLRFDTDVNSHYPDQAIILILKVHDCVNAESVLVEIQRGLGKVVEYEASTGNRGDNILGFYIDYGCDLVEVNCQSWIEEWEPATTDDLFARSKYLSTWLRDYRERYHKLDREHRQLIDGLDKEIIKAVDRDQRKLEFFRNTHSPKAEVVEAVLEVYDRVNRVLHER